MTSRPCSTCVLNVYMHPIISMVSKSNDGTTDNKMNVTVTFTKKLHFFKMLERGINWKIILGEFDFGSLLNCDIRKNS